MATTKVKAKDPPKRRKEVRKDVNVNLRVTEEQKAEMSAAAAHAGVALSSWLVMIALREARREK